MKKYTKNIHANRLRLMLRRDTLHLCPASKDFNPGQPASRLWRSKNEKDVWTPCSICRSFVGLSPDRIADNYKCPCCALGKEEALKRTEKALRRHYGKNTTKNNRS